MKCENNTFLLKLNTFGDQFWSWLHTPEHRALCCIPSVNTKILVFKTVNNTMWTSVSPHSVSEVNEIWPWQLKLNLRWRKFLTSYMIRQINCEFNLKSHLHILCICHSSVWYAISFKSVQHCTLKLPKNSLRPELLTIAESILKVI